MMSLTSSMVQQVFVLSAIAPEKMPFVLQNVRKILKVRYV